MYCYLVANVIIFPLRCFYKNGYFSKNTDFFSTFSEKQGHFSTTNPNFHAIFRKNASIFHRNPKNRNFWFFRKTEAIKNIFQLFHLRRNQPFSPLAKVNEMHHIIKRNYIVLFY